MTRDGGVRDALVGRDTVLTRCGAGIAASLFIATSGYALGFGRRSLLGRTPLYVLLVLGVVVAGASAYHNSGLLVSWLLVLAPTVGPIAANRVFLAGGKQPVLADPFSLYGSSALAFWLPTALFLGSLAFGAGITIRWTHRDRQHRHR